MTKRFAVKCSRKFHCLEIPIERGLDLVHDDRCGNRVGMWCGYSYRGISTSPGGVHTPGRGGIQSLATRPPNHVVFTHPDFP